MNFLCYSPVLRCWGSWSCYPVHWTTSMHIKIHIDRRSNLRIICRLLLSLVKTVPPHSSFLFHFIVDWSYHLLFLFLDFAPPSLFILLLLSSVTTNTPHTFHPLPLLILWLCDYTSITYFYLVFSEPSLSFPANILLIIITIITLMQHPYYALRRLLLFSSLTLSMLTHFCHWRTTLFSIVFVC